MGWTIGGVTARVYDDSPTRTALYAKHNVLDATKTTLSYYGAQSIERSLSFWLLPEDGATGKDTLDTAAITNADVALVSDSGSEGNWRIMSFKPKRVMDVSRSGAVWNCTIDLIKSE
jgi:hypothetical protein